MADKDTSRRLREATFIPDHRVELVPSPKRVRALFGGEVIADSRSALLLRESGHVPVYYFPRGDCRMDCMFLSDRRTHCPSKGEARHWDLAVGGRRANEAAREYEIPAADGPDLRGYVAFDWRSMEAWLEEEEEIFVHPRDPFKRVDVLNSSRHVRVILDGDVVAETHRPVLLFETGLPTRYYFPMMDVRREHLVHSKTVTRCPYKGEARYYSIRSARGLREDFVWCYRYPLAEVDKIAGLLCFYNERVDTLYVDGKPEEVPPTPWSPGQ